MTTTPHEDRHEERRREDRGPQARGPQEPESGPYRLPGVLIKGGQQFNINTVIAIIIVILTTGGGYKAWSVGSSVDDAAKAHTEATARHDAALSALTKIQGDVNSKVDIMTSQFTQLLTSQGELRAAQVIMGKAQDDLRVEIASLKASGTETKVRDMDAILRKQGEDIAELKALLREKK